VGPVGVGRHVHNGNVEVSFYFEGGFNAVEFPRKLDVHERQVGPAASGETEKLLAA